MQKCYSQIVTETPRPFNSESVDLIFVVQADCFADDVCGEAFGENTLAVEGNPFSAVSAR